MIDFAALVLSPSMAVFGKPVTVTPRKSSPNAPPFAANGIWTVTQVDIVTDDGGMLSSRSLKFGINMEDFSVALKQGDWISTPANLLPIGYWQGDFDPNGNLDFEISDVQPDGQGGSTLILKRASK
jgi:hypothetical protein